MKFNSVMSREKKFQNVGKVDHSKIKVGDLICIHWTPHPALLLVLGRTFSMNSEQPSYEYFVCFLQDHDAWPDFCLEVETGEVLSSL